MLYYSKQKFAELNAYDLRVAKNEKHIEDLKKEVDAFTLKIDEFEQIERDNEKHMTKYLPLQIAQATHDLLRRGIKQKYRAKLSE